MLTIEIGGQALTLLPERAAFLPTENTLLIADAQIGKVAPLQQLALPAPRGKTTETLGALTALLRRTGARRVVFLGDFLHSAHAHAQSTLGALSRWRSGHLAIDLVMVRGSHANHAGDPPKSLRMRVVDEPFLLGGLALCHRPHPHVRHFTLAGHLHPCVTLGEQAFNRVRVPCFHFTASVGVLPAFGSLTGMHPVESAAGDRLFAIANDTVIEVPPQVSS